MDRAIDDLERKATTEQSTAKSYEAIPLPYEPLFKEKVLCHWVDYPLFVCDLEIGNLMVL